MATVFVFTGRAYYGKPGINWQMAEVQEDYAERRPFKGSWAKAQSWLVAHGYRRLWATPVGRDGCDVTQVWGLVWVFGDKGTVARPAIRSPFPAGRLRTRNSTCSPVNPAFAGMTGEQVPSFYQHVITAGNLTMI